MDAQWNTTGTAQTEPRPSCVNAPAMNQLHRHLEVKVSRLDDQHGIAKPTPST